MDEHLETVQVILNPAAGRGRGERAWPAVRRCLGDAGVPWSMHATDRTGDATRLAAEAARRGARTVVVVGGDGTVNEAVNGLLAHDDTAGAPVLGVVPAGNGNDFAKPLGIPRGNVEAACRVVAAGRTRVVDVGQVNGRWFVNGVGIGLDGQVALETRSTRSRRGVPMYGMALVTALRRHRSSTMRIEMDGRRIDRRVTMLNVTNGPCHGGGFWICPHARIDDGLLDLCLAEEMGRARLALLALLVMRGRHVGRRGVSFTHVRHVSVHADPAQPAHVDGEILSPAVERLEVRVGAGALRVLAGESGLSRAWRCASP